MTLPDEMGMSPLDLALKSRRIESIVVLLLAEYPVSADQVRKIEAFVNMVEPMFMNAYAGYLLNRGKGRGDWLVGFALMVVEGGGGLR